MRRYAQYISVAGHEVVVALRGGRGEWEAAEVAEDADGALRSQWILQNSVSNLVLRHSNQSAMGLNVTHEGTFFRGLVQLTG